MGTPGRIATVLAGGLAVILGCTGIAQAATTVALWHMDDPARMVDSSGHGNNGSTTAITGVAGFSGQGYHFNGKNSVVTVSDSASLDPGAATLVVTAHVRFSAAPPAGVGDYDLIRKGLAGTAGGDWKMEILPTAGRPAPAFCLFQDTGGKKAQVWGGSNLANSAWHTIVCTKTASAVSVTVDGTTTSVAAKLGSINNGKPLALGAKPGGGDQYLGDMDEVRIDIG